MFPSTQVHHASTLHLFTHLPTHLAGPPTHANTQEFAHLPRFPFLLPPCQLSLPINCEGHVYLDLPLRSSWVFVYLCVHVCGCASFHSLVLLAYHFFVSLFISLLSTLSVNVMSICLFIYQSICLSVYLSSYYYFFSWPICSHTLILISISFSFSFYTLPPNDSISPSLYSKLRLTRTLRIFCFRSIPSAP